MIRRRSAAVSVSLVAALSVAMTGCGSSDPDYQGVCVDQRTGQRIDDDHCDDGNGGGHSGGGGHSSWVYFPRGSRVPAVGAPATGGTTTVPHGVSVARGGFGAKSGVVGG